MHINHPDDEGTPIDRAIRRAMDDGKFDGLAGHGQPFPKEDENPWEDPTAWAAHRLLKAAGFSLPWIEERKEIEDLIISARASLIRSFRYWRDVPPEYFGDGRWQDAVQSFRERCANINQMIRSYNLKAPMVTLHIVVIDIEREIRQVAGS